MIYVEKEKDECSFVSVNTIARGRILPPNNAPLYPIKEQTPPESSAQSNEVLQLKKLDSNEKAMEGIGENVANSKTDLISSPYSSSSQNGVSERAWLSSWDQRNPQYLKAPWLS